VGRIDSWEEDHHCVRPHDRWQADVRSAGSSFAFSQSSVTIIRSGFGVVFVTMLLLLLLLLIMTRSPCRVNSGMTNILEAIILE